MVWAPHADHIIFRRGLVEVLDELLQKGDVITLRIEGSSPAITNSILLCTRPSDTNSVKELSGIISTRRYVYFFAASALSNWTREASSD